MRDQILQYEPQIRLGFFLGVFAVMALWEILAPRRGRALSRRVRWTNNLALVTLNTVVLRVLIPTAAVGVALLAEDRGWGLLNLAPPPFWIAVVLSVLVLDLAIYLQHVMFHAVPVLWRLHRVHHADLDIDVTTGARFHPIEILLSMIIKMGVVLALGPPALAVLVFEVLLNATSMFNHANARLSLALDRFLRLVVVTPDMHRVHHSIEADETNSNFGFNLPWWDRLMGTYRDQPREGHAGMTIGLNQFRTPRDEWLDRLLVQPFKGEIGGYPLNRGSDRE